MLVEIVRDHVIEIQTALTIMTAVLECARRLTTALVLRTINAREETALIANAFHRHAQEIQIVRLIMNAQIISVLKLKKKLQA